jgi:UDP-glucuronate 4-epimerase
LRVLVTGAAGFIGFFVARRLLARGDRVTGFDNLNAYYDPGLKAARLTELDRMGGDWAFRRADLADRAAVEAAFGEADKDGGPFDRVIHLAAQAGVRYSLENPIAYVEANLVGFTRLLEACRQARTPHLVFASTSSVYGANTAMPFEEGQEVGHPLQFYAATKRANELMAHAYAHLFALPCTGLRFFTVYGPWGRPDMAPMLFADAISAGKPLRLFSGGNHSRDFTYVEDIAEGVVRAADAVATPDPAWDPAAPDPGTSVAPFRLYNIGNGAPVPLLDFIAALERALGRKALTEALPPQPGDVPDTWADCARLEAATGWRPATPVEEGVARFVAWYRAYYGRP